MPIAIILPESEIVPIAPTLHTPLCSSTYPKSRPVSGLVLPVNRLYTVIVSNLSFLVHEGRKERLVKWEGIRIHTQQHAPSP